MIIDSVTVNGTFMFNGHDIYAPNTDTVALRQKLVWSFNSLTHFLSIYDNVAFGVYAEKKRKLNWMKLLKSL